LLIAIEWQRWLANWITYQFFLKALFVAGKKSWRITRFLLSICRTGVQSLARQVVSVTGRVRAGAAITVESQ